MNLQNSDKASQTEKKKYDKPELIVYGDISDLTENVTDLGTFMDNPTMKT